MHPLGKPGVDNRSPTLIRYMCVRRRVAGNRHYMAKLWMVKKTVKNKSPKRVLKRIYIIYYN